METWKMIHLLVDEMFTRDYQNGKLNRRQIHFYGNDGVCLFKYFVKENDPQKTFVWSCLGVNLFCFFIISFCYGVINVKYEDSNENMNLPLGNQTEEDYREKREFQRNIAGIIITDFICWVPFFFICILHSLELIDATPTYPVFSLVVLPINAVINPLLYGSSLRDRVMGIKQGFERRFSRIETIGRPLEAVANVENIEMHVIRNRNLVVLRLPAITVPEEPTQPVHLQPVPLLERQPIPRIEKTEIDD